MQMLSACYEEKGRNSLSTTREDAGRGEEEKIPPYKRRGRPQKPLKDDIEDGENAKCHMGTKDVKSQPPMENGRKRNRSSQVKDNPVKDENGVGTKTNTEDSL